MVVSNLDAGRRPFLFQLSPAATGPNLPPVTGGVRQLLLVSSGFNVFGGRGTREFGKWPPSEPCKVLVTEELQHADPLSSFEGRKCASWGWQGSLGKGCGPQMGSGANFGGAPVARRRRIGRLMVVAVMIAVVVVMPH